MSFLQRVDDFSDNVCEDLKQDLDVYHRKRREVKEILWKSYEVKVEEGISEEDSERHTFKELGSAGEYRKNINLKYLPKVKKRTKIRFLALSIFIPLSIAISAYFLSCNLIEFYYLRKVNTGKNIATFNGPFQPKIDIPTSNILKIIKSSKTADLSYENYEKLKKYDPENGYFDLLYFSNESSPYFDNNYDISDEMVYKKKLGLIKRYLVSKKYQTFNSEVCKTLNETTRPSLFLTNITIWESLSNNIKYLPRVRSFIRVQLTIIENFQQEGNTNDAMGALFFISQIIDKQILCAEGILDFLLVRSISREILEKAYIQKLFAKNPSTGNFKEKLEYITSLRNRGNSEAQKTILKNKGAYSSFLLTAITSYMGEQLTEQHLTPTKRLEYLAFERYNLSLVSMLVCSILFILYLLFIIRYKKFKAQNQLPLFSVKVWIKIHLLYVTLPLIIYQLMKVLPLASQENALNSRSFTCAFELLILCFFIFACSSWKIAKSSYKEIITTERKKKDKSKLKILEWIIYLIFGSISALIIYSETFNISFSKNFLFEYYWNANFLTYFNSEESQITQYVFLLIFLFPFYVRFAFFFADLRFIKLKALPAVFQNLLIHGSIVLITITIYCNFYIGLLERKNYHNDNLLRIPTGKSVMAAESRIIDNIKLNYTENFIEKLDNNE